MVFTISSGSFVKQNMPICIWEIISSTYSKMKRPLSRNISFLIDQNLKTKRFRFGILLQKEWKDIYKTNPWNHTLIPKTIQIRMFALHCIFGLDVNNFYWLTKKPKALNCMCLKKVIILSTKISFKYLR